MVIGVHKIDGLMLQILWEFLLFIFFSVADLMKINVKASLDT